MSWADEVERAAAPGRVRELVVAAYAAARGDPWRAGKALSDAQRGLRTLRSRQRRWVVEALFDLVRHGAVLERLVGSDRPDALWVGWLVWHGLDPEVAARVSGEPGPFDRCARFEEAVDAELAALAPVEAIAWVGGVDPAVAAALIDRYGPDGARAFVEASNARAPLAVRANRLRTTRDELIAALEAEGIRCGPGRWAPDAVVVDGWPDLGGTRAARDGWLEVQDEGSQLLAALVQAEGVVVDLCAGAGGKALAMAPDAARVIACDVREGPLNELRERATRAGARVETHRLGAAGALPGAVAAIRADRVLVDAPCTGTGALRRHPEHRWQVDGARIEALVASQGAILERAAPLVRPGGRLVYGTCSVLPAENRAVVAAFLARHPEFAPLPARELLGPDHGDALEVAPHTHGTDGFFGMVLVRR